MLSASELREGMAVRIDRQVYRVVEVEARAPTAQMSGTIRARLSNLRSGRTWDQHFRPLEKLENVALEKGALQFLYSDGKTCAFLRTDTYDQVEFPASALGWAEKLMNAGEEIPAEFYDGEPVRIALPQTGEARIATTAPATRGQQDSGRKEAVLENGMKIYVPLFVGPGETVRIDLATGHYVERVRVERKKGT